MGPSLVTYDEMCKLLHCTVILCSPWSLYVQKFIILKNQVGSCWNNLTYKIMCCVSQCYLCSVFFAVILFCGWFLGYMCSGGRFKWMMMDLCGQNMLLIWMETWTKWLFDQYSMKLHLKAVLHIYIVVCRPVTRQWPWNKQIPMAVSSRATIEELLEMATSPRATIRELLDMVFSLRSVPRGYVTRTPAEQ
jgi:hypothetical protein